MAAKAGKNLAVNADFQTTTTALELAGRTQLVLLARELLFRACESAANNWMTGPEMHTVYDKVIEALVQMTENAGKEADAKIKNAETAANAVKIDTKILAASAEHADAYFRQQCIADYDRCMSDAAGDAGKEKTCKATAADCYKGD